MTFCRFRESVFQSAYISGRPAGTLEVSPETSSILMSTCKRRAPGKAGTTISATGLKSNLEATKNDKNDDFSRFDFESIFEAGVPQGSSQSIFGIQR